MLVKFRGGFIIWKIFYYGAVLRYFPLTITVMLVKGLRVLKFVGDFLNVAWN